MPSVAPDAVPDAVPAGPARDLSERNELVVQHLPLVRAIAAKLYRMRWNSAVGYDEYCQLGALGLVEAANRYDPTRGATFGTFATWRISGSILNGLERSTEQHQQIASRRRLLQSRLEMLTEAEGEPAADGVAAALARLSEAAVGLAIGFMLEGTGMFDDGEAAHGLDGYANLAMRQRRQRLHAALGTLPQVQRRVIEGHYLQQLPFAEIAETLGLTRGRIAQIHRAALDRLRDILRRSAADFEA